MFSKLIDIFKNWKQNSRYFIVAVIVFFVGVIFHFPLERFGSVITTTIQKETGYIMQAEKLSFTLPIGIHAKNVQIQSPPSGGPAMLLKLNELTLRPSVFALLTYPFRKTFGFSYKAIREKEIWSGSASFGKENSSLDVRAKNFEWSGSFPLDQNEMFAGKNIDVHAVLNIDFSVSGKTIELQQGNLSEAKGSIEITSKKTDIEAPMVNQMKFSNITFESTLDKGTLNVKNVNLIASNLNGQAKGEIKVAPFFPHSQIKLNVQLKPDAQDTNMTSLIQLFGSMYGIQPGSDGTLGFKITGLLNSAQRLSISTL